MSTKQTGVQVSLGRPLGLLSVKETAAQFGVCTATIRRWHKVGKLPGFRTPGGVLRIDPRAIQAMLAQLDAA